MVILKWNDSIILFDRGAKSSWPLVINLCGDDATVTFKPHFLFLLLKKNFTFILKLKKKKKHFLDNITEEVTSLLKTLIKSIYLQIKINQFNIVQTIENFNVIKKFQFGHISSKPKRCKSTNREQ